MWRNTAYTKRDKDVLWKKPSHLIDQVENKKKPGVHRSVMSMPKWTVLRHGLGGENWKGSLDGNLVITLTPMFTDVYLCLIRKIFLNVIFLLNICRNSFFLMLRRRTTMFFEEEEENVQRHLTLFLTLFLFCQILFLFNIWQIIYLIFAIYGFIYQCFICSRNQLCQKLILFMHKNGKTRHSTLKRLLCTRDGWYNPHVLSNY